MVQLKLNKHVGKNCRPNPSDVMVVQTCLANTKIKTKSGMKPAWQGKIDGKNSQDLVLSIMAFEAHEKLKVTGKVEANRGQTWSKLKQKTPHTAMASLATNLAHATPPSGPKNYKVKSGVKLTPAIEKKVAQIANAYHPMASHMFTVTSGTRTPATQAKALFNNMKKGDRLTIYKNQTLAGQIRNAFDSAQAAGKSDRDTISAMEKVIASQVASGKYISKHLISGAVDVRSWDMNAARKTIFENVASKVATSVILETTNPHWHLQF